MRSANGAGTSPSSAPWGSGASPGFSRAAGSHSCLFLAAGEACRGVLMRVTDEEMAAFLAGEGETGRDE